MSLRYLLDDFTIDPGCFAVTRAGQRLALEPKAVTLLLHLLAHRDRVVTKDELTELLWKDTFVTPNAPSVMSGAVSPMARESARISPVRMPGTAEGRTWCQIVCHFVAPSA